jgi:hypothetical protein
VRTISFASGSKFQAEENVRLDIVLEMKNNALMEKIALHLAL